MLNFASTGSFIAFYPFIYLSFRTSDNRVPLKVTSPTEVLIDRL